MCVCVCRCVWAIGIDEKATFAWEIRVTCTISDWDQSFLFGYVVVIVASSQSTAVASATLNTTRNFAWSSRSVGSSFAYGPQHEDNTLARSHTKSRSLFEIHANRLAADAPPFHSIWNYIVIYFISSWLHARAWSVFEIHTSRETRDKTAETYCRRIWRMNGKKNNKINKLIWNVARVGWFLGRFFFYFKY